MTINLHETTDAAIWAAEFCKRFPSALCQVPGREGVTDGDDFEAIMIGWFANVIMAGVDSEARKPVDPATTKHSDLVKWIINNLLNESQLSVVAPGYTKPLRDLPILIDKEQDK